MQKIALDKVADTAQGTVAWTSLGHGPAVVLVHGTPASSLLWREIAPKLAETRTVYIYDLPGYGESEKYEGQQVRLRDQAAVLAELVGQWGLEAPDLIGHDFGAATVLGAHLVEGVPVRSLAVIDGVVLSPWGTPFSRHVRDNVEIFAGVPAHAHKAMLEAHLRTAVFGTLDDATRDALIEPWLGPEGQAAYFRQVAQYDYDYTDVLEPRYASMGVPVAVFWGEQDQWVDISVGRKLAAMVPGARFEPIRDAGHFAMLDRPGEVAARFADWLDEPDALREAS